MDDRRGLLGSVLGLGVVCMGVVAICLARLCWLSRVRSHRSRHGRRLLRVLTHGGSKEAKLEACRVFLSAVETDNSVDLSEHLAACAMPVVLQQLRCLLLACPDHSGDDRLVCLRLAWLLSSDAKAAAWFVQHDDDIVGAKTAKSLVRTLRNLHSNDDPRVAMLYLRSAENLLSAAAVAQGSSPVVRPAPGGCRDSGGGGGGGRLGALAGVAPQAMSVVGGATTLVAATTSVTVPDTPPASAGVKLAAPGKEYKAEGIASSPPPSSTDGGWACPRQSEPRVDDATSVPVTEPPTGIPTGVPIGGVKTPPVPRLSDILEATGDRRERLLRLRRIKFWMKDASAARKHGEPDGFGFLEERLRSSSPLRSSPVTPGRLV